jgi:uncharacterized protein (TIGR03118 family)
MAAKHLLLALTLTTASPALAGTFTMTNLTSDGSVTAAFTDPNLKNPWGISYAPGGPFWVSDNSTGLTTLYDTTGKPQSLVVTIPAAAGATGPGTPTGQVFNPSTTNFMISAGGKSGAANFIFDTEDGTISAWSFSVNPSTAIVAVDNSATQAVYKSLAYYTDSSGANFLLATNFRAGMVEVYDSTFTKVAAWRDPMMSKFYSPYNVAVLNGNIFVTYARVNAKRHDSLSGPGRGALEEVTFSGQVVARVFHGQLNAPWGLALAPQSFGQYAGDILVGNFGSGWITAFTPALAPRGLLKAAGGGFVFADGLWGLIPGNGGSGGSADEIYFTAGTNNEKDGLFGSLSYNP